MTRAWTAVAAAMTIGASMASVPRLRAEQAAPADPPRIVVRQLRSANGPVPRIVNGLRVVGLYPTVGMLAQNGFFNCTATLIGCQTALTAAHCVPDAGAAYTLFLQHAGFVGVASVTRSPDFDFGVRSDIAVLELSTPVTGIAPSLVNIEAEPPLGTVGDIVGFGGVGELFGPNTSHFKSGIKRRGDVVTAACTVVPESSHVCWNFTVPIGPAGTDANTCNGDSGGPLFADVAGLGVAVAGVTSGGNPTCLPNDASFDADVHFDHEWIETVAGGDLAPIACGETPTVLGPDTEVLVDPIGGMTSGTSAVAYEIILPSGRSELRVTTNGELFPTQNYNLYVKLGGQPTVAPADYDCASTNGNSFESCSFTSPAGGSWWVLVTNPSAHQGEYDLTVSILGGPTVGPCPDLDADGNGIVGPLTDGVLVLRHLFGVTGPALTADALGDGATRDDAGVTAHLASCGALLDVDGNGTPETLIDGVLIARYLFGLRGAALSAGVLDGSCVQCEPEAIEAHIQSIL